MISKYSRKLFYAFVFFISNNMLIGSMAHAIGDEVGGALFENIQFISHVAPKLVEPNERVTIEIKVKNVGTTNWSKQDNYALIYGSSKPGDSLGTGRVEFAADETIRPGASKTFSFNLIAPVNFGTYFLEWQVVHNDKPLGGDNIQPIKIVVENPFNRAQFVSQLITTSMEPGAKSKAVIQFKNIGKTAWSNLQGYKLSKVGKEVWGKSFVEIENINLVAPGEIATFSFVVSAPALTGKYDFQWQMTKDGEGLFGEVTPLTTISVAHSRLVLQSKFISMDVPTTMYEGKEYDVNMIFKNTGSASWTVNSIALHSQNPENNLIWLLDRVELASQENIRPGQSKRFNFTVRAPDDVGSYSFEWQLYNTSAGWIGESTSNKSITVIRGP